MSFDFAKRGFDLLALGDVGGDVDQMMGLAVRLSVENAPITREPTYLPIRLHNSVLGWEGILSVRQDMILSKKMSIFRVYRLMQFVPFAADTT